MAGESAPLAPRGPASAAPLGPAPAGVRLPATLRDAIVAWALAEHPNEMCGLVVGSALAADGGEPIRWEPTRNAAASPLRYEVASDDLVRISVEIDDRDEVIWGIVHSHVGSPARPSPTDVDRAFYPDALHLIVSLAPSEADPATGEPGVRAWSIVDGAVHEVALEVR
jgi:proteasome lid subunit RPN8/RPN11